MWIKKKKEAKQKGATKKTNGSDGLTSPKSGTSTNQPWLDKRKEKAQGALKFPIFLGSGTVQHNLRPNYTN